MRHLTSTVILAVALSAAVSLGAAMPAHPIGTGSATFLSAEVGILGLDFSLVQLPNGELQGQGTQVAPDVDGDLEFDLTSYALLDGIPCMAGPITESVNTPFAIGDTWILCIEDNGNGGSGTPDRIARAVAPPGLSIQIILAGFPGFLPPPDSEFTPIESGNDTIH